MKPFALAAAFAGLAVGGAFAQDAVGLALAQSGQHGRYLTDAQGRAVYLLETDEKGKSRCYGVCAEVWPPVPAVQGSPAARDPAVRQDRIGTLERRDGSRQLTYNGHPLYYYAGDRGAGRATGHDVDDRWGEWYLVTGEGTKLQSRAKSASAGGSPRPAPDERTFLTLDEDRDGKVTREEARGMPRLARHFGAADADGDGSVSRYEFNTFISR